MLAWRSIFAFTLEKNLINVIRVVPSLRSRGAMKSHTRTHTRTAREKPYKCDMCRCPVCTKLVLWRSHIRTHTGEKPYKCDMCHAHFAESSTLTKHIRTHTGEKSYKCDTCGAQFARTGPLKIHIRTHTGERPFKCNMCPAQFAQSGGLKRHICTHTCGMCCAQFAQTGDLKRHSRIHSGENLINVIRLVPSLQWLMTWRVLFALTLKNIL